MIRVMLHNENFDLVLALNLRMSETKTISFLGIDWMRNHATSVSIEPQTLKLCGAFMLEIIIRKYHDKGPLLSYLYICGFWNLPLLTLAFSVEVAGLSFLCVWLS